MLAFCILTSIISKILVVTMVHHAPFGSRIGPAILGYGLHWGFCLWLVTILEQRPEMWALYEIYIADEQDSIIQHIMHVIYSETSCLIMALCITMSTYW